MDGPSDMAIRDELKRMKAETDKVIADATAVGSRGDLGTDAAVKRILKNKQQADD